ncbi:conserved oligomeric Golgi complex subunit 8 isoform X2 [Sitophilus oryzae]|uniref:Conserved oligomeric Golgi complex subunit 8 n=1 Tax=Sitophilus oryzae TaxID=7048 RepID=A0A6J2YIA4_SITOR|nr:conserved oligomeric Golgi complex subunit 8 isoform X2 [Sitophilus oryzae]
MDEEKNLLISLIFPEVEEDYQANFKKYLSLLGKYKVEELLKEPQHVNVEYNNIQDQTQDLAVTNYKTFIETSECSKELFSQFNMIEHKLNNLLIDIPQFQEKSTNFSKETGQINHLRKLNSLTLTRNAQLLEILELPQLMNSFINDGLYEEALELVAYVRKLCTKYSDIPIFKSILKDVNDAWFLMLHQLLSQLKQDLTLSKCIQIVGHLRLMEIFTELELKLKFLQARGYWLEQCLKYIPREDPTHHLKRTIELTRVNLFNIITQYKAIFNEDYSPINSIKSDVNENNIFYSWINDRISDFLVTLEEDLKYSVLTEAIMEQCMYFGSSFGKVGCDFRLLLIPIFTKQISENFKASISKALTTFGRSIENFTLINKHLPNIPWRNKDGDPLHPPDSLLEFYPLAEYLNNVLRTFNAFRVFAPITLLNDVTNTLENSLIAIAKSIVRLHSQEQQAFTNNSKDAFTRLCMTFSDDLIPYIQKCIHTIFPSNKIANKLGVSIQVLEEENISFLRRDLIVDCIKHFLPPKVEPNFDTKEFNQNKLNTENLHEPIQLDGSPEA